MPELEEDIDPLTPVEELRLGQQQIVEIARALSVEIPHPHHGRADVGAERHEVEVLFKVIRDLTAAACRSSIFRIISKRRLQITDHAVVLRDGAMTAMAAPETSISKWIVRNMVGENFDLGSPPTGHENGGVALSRSRMSACLRSGGLYSVVDRLPLTCALARSFASTG